MDAGTFAGGGESLEAGRAGRWELLVEDNEFYKTYALDYHDGLRYPHLERDAAKADILGEIIKPLTGEKKP